MVRPGIMLYGAQPSGELLRPAHLKPVMTFKSRILQLKEVPKTLPGLERFWMAGQWVAPGGGLPSGAMTARQVQQLICHEDGVPFRTTTA